MEFLEQTFLMNFLKTPHLNILLETDLCASDHGVFVHHLSCFMKINSRLIFLALPIHCH